MSDAGGAGLGCPSTKATFRNVLRILSLKSPFSYITWPAAILFALVYSFVDQVFVASFDVAKPVGLNLPLIIKVFGPQPMLGPPQVAYYLTFFGNFGMLQINLTALPVVAMLSIFFGLNLSLAMLLRGSGRGAKSFASLASILPSLVNTAGCCSFTPFFLLLVGGAGFNWIGLALLPYYGWFVYTSFALSTFSIYFLGRRVSMNQTQCLVALRSN